MDVSDSSNVQTPDELHSAAAQRADASDQNRNPFAEESSKTGWRVDGSDDLGVGSPFVDSVDRRDFTVKASRRLAPAPPQESYTTPPTSYVSLPPAPATAPASTATFPSDHTPSTIPIASRRGHRHSSSASSVPSSTRISYAPIPDPRYVRSQPINLSRSNSLTDGTMAPTVSGGLIRRGSISSASEDESEGEDGERGDRRKAVNRPTKHRSESLPSFPPEELFNLQRQHEEQKNELRLRELSKLPTNPKMWMPSHLAVYISHHLSLHPRLSDDITAFVRTSRLDGRTFIRLKEIDLEEMGVNVVWRKALLEAKNTLRREALGGKVFWGFEGVRYGDGEGWDEQQQPTKKPTLERRPSNVEGSDQEEEAGKEEWKRSWRMLQGGRRVRGMVSKFDDVVEASREGTPNPSPTKDKSLRIEGSEDGQVKRRSRIFPQSPYPPPGGHDRGNSTESTTSTASIDSGSGSGFSLDDSDTRSSHYFSASRGTAKEANLNAYKTPPSGFIAHSSSQPSHLRSYFSPDSNNSAFPSPHHSRAPLDPDADQVDSPTTLTNDNDPLNGNTPPSGPVEPSADYQSKISAHSRPYGLVRRPSEKAREALLLLHRDAGPSAQEKEEGGGGGGEVERTVRAASEGTSSAGFGVEKRMGLGELFGIEVPSVAGTGGRKDELDEVVEMEVGARGGKKGSMVMVKRSQLTALSRRMAEVESQVALAQGSSVAPSDVGEEELDELEKRLQGIEALLPLSSPASPTRSTRSSSYPAPAPMPDIDPTTDLTVPTPSHSQILSTWVSSSLSSRSLSELAATSHESARQLMDASGPLMSWTALGGYCVAASIGIGIVAGEVVAARLLGIRRR
ncbi:hypothetical protein BCR35DRAFT_302347 [Leucosporidium creatinivorum]|uniref:SAM domain-containing protein n=1 Tax=Leucosporidium creatinivorum TaxID=106004 RepID=A0A1Y2FRN0_9BASI|nr:hypothetical protein BCR35DRAFT_302347 [Leucosporidium creatinivorum]